MAQMLTKLWCQLGGTDQTPCYGLQPTAGYISQFVWNNIYIFTQNTDD
jgi:hypothetical protein